MLLTIPMALAMVAMTDMKAIIRPAALKAAGLTFIIALLLYLYIPLAALKDPVVNWGNPINLDSFIYYITQKEYSFKIAAGSLKSALQVFFLALKLFILEFTPLGFFLVLCGSVVFWKKYRKIFISFFIIIIGNIGLMINYGGTEQDIPILFRYLFPSYIVMSIWAGSGLQYIFVYSKAHFKRPLFSSLICVALPLACLITHYHQNDRSKNFVILDYASNVLDTIPPDAMLLTVGDSVSGPLQYLQTAQGERQDLIILDRGLLTKDWYCKHLLKHYPNIVPANILSIPPENRLVHMIEANMSQRPVFATFAMLEQYEKIPYGLVYLFTPKGKFPDFTEIKIINDTLWERYTKRGLLDSRVYKDTMVNEIAEGYGKSKNNLALYYNRNEHDEDAIKEYEEALKFNPENFASLFNLGQLYKQHNRNKEGDRLLQMALKINPDFLLQHTAGAGMAQTSNYAIMQTGSVNDQDAAQRHIQIGIQYGSLGNHQKAIEEFQQALKLKSNDTSTYVLLGTAYMNSYAADAAIDMYKKAIEIDPGVQSATAYLNLGAIYANNKQDYPATLFYLEKYVELAPNSQEAARIQVNIQKIKSMLHESPQKP